MLWHTVVMQCLVIYQSICDDPSGALRSLCDADAFQTFEANGVCYKTRSNQKPFSYVAPFSKLEPVKALTHLLLTS